MTPAGDIPGEGKTFSLTLTGDLPPAGVEVRAQSGGTALVTGTVTKSGTAVSLAVPANATGADRTVTFEYLWNGMWTKIGARTQSGKYVSAASVSPEGNIPQAGGTYTVTLTGWGGFPIRAIDGDGNELAINTAYEEVANYSASILIPANTGTEARSVTFQYSQEGVWTDIESRNQAGSPGRICDYNTCQDICTPLGGMHTYASIILADWENWAGPSNSSWWIQLTGYANAWLYGTQSCVQSTKTSAGCRCMNE